MQQNADIAKREYGRAEGRMQLTTQRQMLSAVSYHVTSFRERPDATRWKFLGQPSLPGMEHEKLLGVRQLLSKNLIQLCTDCAGTCASSCSQLLHTICDFENVSKLNEITKRSNASRRPDEEELDEIDQQLSWTKKAKRVLSCKFRRA